MIKNPREECIQITTTNSDPLVNKEFIYINTTEKEIYYN
jgi:hypothetical protein